MDPKTLFKPGLTVPEHEVRDLHYIGEALPVPSLITSSISIEADASVGGSPVPAREDHIHAVDVDSLIQFINDNPTTVDLTNYYTKAEIDIMLDEIVAGEFDLTNYYTKAEVDAFINVLADAIDALDVRVTALETLTTTLNARRDTYEQYWSYGTTVNPASNVSLGLYVCFRKFYVHQTMMTLTASDGTNTISVVVTKIPAGGGTPAAFLTDTLASGNIFDTTVWGPLAVDVGEMLHVVLQAVPGGTGEVLVFGIRGSYDPWPA